MAIKFSMDGHRLPTPWVLEQVFNLILTIGIFADAYLVKFTTLGQSQKEMWGMIIGATILIARFGMGFFSEVGKLESIDAKIKTDDAKMLSMIDDAEIKQEEIKEAINKSTANEPPDNTPA